MTILSIETSCDETAMALITERDGKFEVVRDVLASQAQIHAKFGGVVPEVAAREHAAWVMPLIKQLGVNPSGEGIDAIAVTAGPGLVPALRIGVKFGKALAWMWDKPLVSVNHLEGHIYSVWIKQKTTPQLPALCLLVSGGHTELILMKDHGEYELLGRTRDDAAGEAFDKVAKLLGLGYPGGPVIEKLAQQGDPAAIAFPRPMLNSGDFDFSFAGLKTAVRVYLEQNQNHKKEDVCASFMAAVVDTLVKKTLRAAQQTKPQSVILSGGVSASKFLREGLDDTLRQAISGVTFHVPDLSLTGDNAVMIGVAGLMKLKRGEIADPLTLTADPNMRLA